MKRHALVALALATIALGSSVLAEAAPGTPVVRRTAAPIYGQLPLSFEPNLGQTDERVKFVARGRGYALFLTANEAVLRLGRASEPSSHPKNEAIESAKSSIVRLTLLDHNTHANVIGVDELAGKASYFVGDPKTWRTNVPTYAKVKYEDVYPGVDLVYYGNGRQLEYDFIVGVGAHPKTIRFVAGADAPDKSSLRIDGDGNLVVSLDGGEVRFRKPLIYQPAVSGGDRHVVDGRFALLGHNTVGFDLGAYDTSRPLVIDPVLEYSTFFGDTEQDAISSIAVDASGNAYVTGFTNSFDDFPTNTDLSPDNGGTTTDLNTDAFAAKINPEGTGYVWSTYLGGTDYDWGFAIATDGSGNVYVTGRTISEDFPLANEFDGNTAGVGNAFVTKIAADASAVLYSTYLNAAFNTARGMAIAADDVGNAYVTGVVGNAPGFPQRGGFITDGCDSVQRTGGFITRLDTTKSGDESLVYSTVLCGNITKGLGIAIDGIGNAYVAGETDWADFPIKNGFQTECGNCEFTVKQDAFFAKVDTDASGEESLVYSTFIGGSGDDGAHAIALDADGFAYVVGGTNSVSFPTTEGVFQPETNFFGDAFVMKIDPAGVGEESLVWSTFLGGSDFERASGVGLDDAGNVYVTGVTTSADFPTRNRTQDFAGGDENSQFDIEGDAFVVRLRADASALRYGTFLGGTKSEGILAGIGISQLYFPAIAVDSSGNAYIGGATVSADFPTGEAGVNAYLDTLQGGADGYITKLALNPDFTLDEISDITLDLGASDTRTVTVNSLDSFNSAVTLSVPTPPAGFVISFADNPVTPAADESVSTTMTVELGLAAVPGTSTLDVTGTAGALTHSTPVDVTVNASISGTEDVIDGLTAIGCIDNSGVSNALLAKLARAQAFIDAGNTQAAINTLNALLNQLNAQKGKHIATSCTENSQTFDPSQVLITLVQTLLADLGVTAARAANPIIGYVLNAQGQAVVGATVSLVGSLKVSAITDVTGLYYFPNTGVLIAGAKYTANVSSLPKPYKSSAPSTQAFVWSKKAVFLAKFAVK